MRFMTEPLDGFQLAPVCPLLAIATLQAPLIIFFSIVHKRPSPSNSVALTVIHIDGSYWDTLMDLEYPWSALPVSLFA